MPAAKPYLRVSGGTPNGYPDFVPLNPWGRGFPKIERYGPRHSLHQVVVLDSRDGNKAKPIGPKMTKECAEVICMAVREQIALGAERRWVDPIVVSMS